MTDPRKQTPKQREYSTYMRTVLQQLEWDLHETIYMNGRIPPAWEEIANTRHRDSKVRITLAVEANVVRFFKSMGTGYQVRMNDVLAAWMYARLSGVLSGRDTAPEFVEKGDRPRF